MEKSIEILSEINVEIFLTPMKIKKAQNPEKSMTKLTQ